MRSKRRHLPPAWLLAAAADRVSRQYEREYSVTTRYRYEANTQWQRMRGGVQDYFGQHFSHSLPSPRRLEIETPPSGGDVSPLVLLPVWDPVRADRLDTMDAFESALDEQVDDLRDTVEEYQDEVDDAAREGYLTGLWLMDQQGVEAKPKRSLAGMGLALAAFGGLTFRQRADSWLAGYRDKAQRSFKAALVSGATLDDTLGILDALNHRTERAVTGMLSDELFFAYLQGNTEAFQDYQGNLFGELWVTTEDERVCPICEPRHLTITPLIPIRDSHPTCRCWKVPLAASPLYQASSYEAFADALDADEAEFPPDDTEDSVAPR